MVTQTFRIFSFHKLKKRSGTVKPVLFLLISIFILSFIPGRSFAQVTYTWTGTTSTAWNLATNWNNSGGGTFPGTATSDIVIIPGGITNQPLLNTATTTSITSLTFTGSAGASGSLTITGQTLTVTGTITLNNQAASNSAATIAGNGTISCAAVQVGSNVDPTSAGTTRAITLTSTITNFIVSGNITLNSAIGADNGRRANANFSHISGTVAAGGLVSSNEDAVNVSAYTMGASTPRLNLYGATPLTRAVLGTSTFTFNGTGATVEYRNAANFTFPAVSPTAYTNLIISGGGGTKTLAINTTVSAALTVRAATTLDLSTFTLSTPTSVALENASSVDGSTIAGTGALTLGGNVTVTYTNSAAAMTRGVLISSPVILTGNRSFTIADDPNSTVTDMTISGNISGAFGITKVTNTSALLLTGDNSAMTGTSTLTSGVLVAGNIAALGSAGQTVVLTAGTFELATDASVNAYNLSTTGTGAQTITINRATAGPGITHTFGNLLLSGKTITIAAGVNATSDTAALAFAGTTTFNGTPTLNVNNGAGAPTLLLLADATLNAFTGTIGGSGFIRQTGVWGNGSGGITRNGSGSGTLTLSQANTYTGITTLTAGNLIITNPAAMGAAGQTVVLTAGTLDLQTDASINAYNLSTTGTSGTITINSNKATPSSPGIIHTFGDLLIGRTLVFTGGSNANSGVTGITFNGVCSLTAASTFTVNNSGVGSSTTLLTVGTVLNGSFTTTVNGTGAVEQTGVWGDGTGPLVYSGTGAGTLTLSQANTYTGGTVLTSGSLTVTNPAGMGAAGQVVTLTAGTLTLATSSNINAYNISTTGTGAVNIVSDRDGTGAGIIYNLGTLAINARTITVTGGTNATSGVAGITFCGTTTFRGAPVFSIVNGPSSTTLFTVADVANGAFTATVNGDGNMEQTGVWGNGIGGIIKGGSGTLRLSKANTYTGNTTINSVGGSLVVSDPAGMGASGKTVLIGAGSLDLATNTSVNTYNIVVSGTLDVNIISNRSGAGAGITHILGNLAIGGRTLTVTGGTDATSGVTGIAFSGIVSLTQATVFTVVNGSGTSTALLTLDILSNVNRLVTFNGDGNVNQTGVWGWGNASGGITYNGSGSLTLDQVNTYTGTTLLSSGTLNINSSNALGSGALSITGGTIQNTSGAAVTLSTNNAMTWNGDFDVTGTQDLNMGTGAVTLGPNRQVTVGPGITFTAGGAINAATRSIAKAGNGTLSFGSQAISLNDVNIIAGTLVATSGSMTLTGDLVNTGNFTHNDGIVIFNAGAGQNIAAVNFNKLIISGNKSGGTITLGTGTIGIANYLLASATNVVYATTGNTVDFNGTISQNIPGFNYNSLSITNDKSGGTVTLANGTIGVAENFTVTASNVTYVKTGNTVNFNGTGAQSIGPFDFNNLTISGDKNNNTVTFGAGTIGIAGTFITSGATGISGYITTGNTVDFNGTGAQSIGAFNFNNLTISGNKGGNAITLANGGTIGVAGVFSASGATNVSSYIITNNTFDFNGTGAQVIDAFNFNNLTISGNKNSNTITFASGTIGVAGAFSTSGASGISGYVTTGNTVDFNGTGAQSIEPFNFNDLVISGNKNNNTITLASGTIGVAGTFATSGASNISSYITTGNTVDFNGTGAQSIDAFNFNNLAISGNKGGGAVTLVNGGTIRVAGTFSVTATNLSYTTTNNTFDFNGTGSQTIPAFTFNNLIISNGGTKSILISTTVTVKTLIINNNTPLSLPNTQSLVVNE